MAPVKAEITIRDIVAATGHTRQHVNRVCRKVFGPAGGYRRTFTREEYERLRKVIQQPGRRKKFHVMAQGATDRAN